MLLEDAASFDAPKPKDDISAGYPPPAPAPAPPPTKEEIETSRPPYNIFSFVLKYFSVVLIDAYFSRMRQARTRIIA